jgi:hypothetical protein
VEGIETLRFDDVDVTPGTASAPDVTGISDATATEGDTLTFDVTLGDAIDTNASLDWTLSGDTSAVQTTSGNINISEGQDTATISVATVDNDTPDSSRSVTLSAVGGDGIDPNGQSATGIIQDDGDSGSETGPTFTVSGDTVDEGGQLNFEVRLKDPAPAGGSDFNLQINRPTGETFDTKTFNVQENYTYTYTYDLNTLQDELDEPDLTWTFEASGSNGVVPADDGVAAGTVRDDDPTPTVTVADTSTVEGDDLRFDVSLDTASASPITLDWEISGSTADVATTSGTTQIDSEAQSGTIRVGTVDNEAIDGTREVSLSITSVDGANGDGASATGTIGDDDGAAGQDQIDVSLDMPSDGTFNGDGDKIRTAIKEGVARWDQEINAAPGASIEINVTDNNNSALASAKSKTYRPTNQTIDGERVYESGTGYEIRTGGDPNGDTPDAVININTSYLDQFDFDGSFTGNEQYNATDIMMHEFGHALGFASAVTRDNNNNLVDDTSNDYVFDTMIEEYNGEFWFTGTNAVQANGGNDVELAKDNGTGLNNQKAHISEDVFGTALMTPQANRFQSLELSDVGRGIIEDLGYNLHDTSSGQPGLEPDMAAFSPAPNSGSAPALDVQKFGTIGSGFGLIEPDLVA